MRTRSPRRPRTAPRRSIFLLAAAAAAPGPAHGADLTVTVEEIRTADGTLLVQAVRGERGFDGVDEPVAQLMVQPVVPATRFTLELPPGTYGLRLFQDLDGDGALATNLVGLPSEPWAFSRNAVGTFGPPGWDEVRFEVGDQPAAQSIRLNH